MIRYPMGSCDVHHIGGRRAPAPPVDAGDLSCDSIYCLHRGRANQGLTLFPVPFRGEVQ